MATAVNGSGNEITDAIGGEEVVFSDTTPEKEAEVDRLIDENEKRFAAEESTMTISGDGVEPFDASGMTPEQIAAGLRGLSGGIATAQEVENAARSEEGLDPLLPLDFGPFNPDTALKAIFEKSAEVRELQSNYETKKEAASDAKKELDIAAKALVNIIESLKHRRTQALNPTQPYLRPVDDAAAGSGCPWEREHPGQVCPICSAAQAKDIVPALESAVHPNHEQHVDTAQAAHLLTLAPLAKKLEAVNLFVTVEDLETLSADDQMALESYTSEPTVIPPQLLARCCCAAEPGTILQVCQRDECVRELVEFVTEASAYPVGALVGFQCAAYQPAAVEPFEPPVNEPPQVEPTRTIKARGSKKRAKKEPEEERAKQTDAGRQKAKQAAKRKARR